MCLVISSSFNFDDVVDDAVDDIVAVGTPLDASVVDGG